MNDHLSGARNLKELEDRSTELLRYPADLGRIGERIASGQRREYAAAS